MEPQTTTTTTTTTTRSTRRPRFMGPDHGLASLTHGNNKNNKKKEEEEEEEEEEEARRHVMMRRRNSLRNISCLSPTSVITPSGAAGYDARFEDAFNTPTPPHFLHSCALCHKPLSSNRDIFMYRGDTPFCSEECRQEQIDIDDAKEKNWNLKALRTKKDAKKSSSSSSSSSSKAQNYSFRTGTVAAA
ncbi:hypothetical protein vseg_006485 [Gypsophila vaccaria]